MQNSSSPTAHAIAAIGSAGVLGVSDTEDA
jgi:hypothetical protein